jgi:hypothetical protein
MLFVWVVLAMTLCACHCAGELLNSRRGLGISVLIETFQQSTEHWTHSISRGPIKFGLSILHEIGPFFERFTEFQHIIPKGSRFPFRFGFLNHVDSIHQNASFSSLVAWISLIFSATGALPSIAAICPSNEDFQELQQVLGGFPLIRRGSHALILAVQHGPRNPSPGIASSKLSEQHDGGSPQ